MKRYNMFAVIKNNPMVKMTMVYAGLLLANIGMLNLFPYPQEYINSNYLLCFSLCIVLIVSALVVAKYWSPLGIIILLFYTVPFDLRKDVISTVTVSLTEWLLFIFCLGWGIRCVMKKKIPCLTMSGLIPLCLLAAILLVSNIFSSDHISRMVWTIRWFEVLFVFVIFSGMDFKIVEYKMFLYASILIMSMLSIIAFKQFVISQGSYLHVTGLFNGHNAFGEYMALMLLLFIPLLKQHWSFWIFGAIFSLVLGLTASRGAILGFLAGFVVFVAFERKHVINRKTLIFCGVLAAVFIFLFVAQPNTVERWANIIVDPEKASERRFEQYKQTWEIIKEHPFGVGIGSLYNYWHDVWAREKTGPHNIYLYVAVELGIHGCAVFMWWLIINIIHIVRSRVRITDYNRRMIISSLLGAIICFMFYNLFDDFFNNNLGIICGSIMGLGVSFSRSDGCRQ